MTEGSKANKTGSVAEQLISCLLREHNIEFEQQCVVGKSIYGTDLKSDFVIEDKKLIIEIKWQQSSGSVDEKFPFLVANLKSQIDYRSIIIVDGGMQRQESINWLKKQIDNKLIGVYTLSEFIIVLNNEGLK